MKKQLKVIELFAGIGAPRKALIRGGYNFKIVDAIEIDKYAVKSYNAIYNANIEPKDVCEYKPDKIDIGEIDLLFHGSPCQDFSLAGKQAGGDKDSGTRSSLMYETIRIVEKLKPKYVVWENVKNLLSKKHRHNFDAYLEIMENLGYNNYYQVLNAKDYRIPQNRERVFTISIRKDIDIDFKFPEKQELKLKLKDMLEDEVDEKYYFSEKMMDYIVANNEKWSGNNAQSLINKSVATTINTGEGKRRCYASNYISTDLPENTDLKLMRKSCIQIGQMYGTNKEPNPQAGRIYSVNGVSPTMDTCSGGNRMPKIMIKNNTKKGYLDAYEGDGVYTNTSTKRGTIQKDMVQTLTTFQDKGVVVKECNISTPYNNKGITDIAPTQTTYCGSTTSSATVLRYDGLRIRKLTPKECWRLMGFDDEDFEKASKVNSNTQLYKQAGNSIVVNVLEAIFDNLLQEYK